MVRWNAYKRKCGLEWFRPTTSPGYGDGFRYLINKHGDFNQHGDILWVYIYIYYRSSQGRTGGCRNPGLQGQTPLHSPQSLRQPHKFFCNTSESGITARCHCCCPRAPYCANWATVATDHTVLSQRPECTGK